MARWPMPWLRASRAHACSALPLGEAFLLCPTGLAAARVSRGVCHRGGPFLGVSERTKCCPFCKYSENGPDNVRVKPEPLTLRFVREPCKRHRREESSARDRQYSLHRHDPLGKGVPAPRLLPPCDPSARRAGTHVADTRSLEQGRGGCRPCSTSGPLGLSLIHI